MIYISLLCLLVGFPLSKKEKSTKISPEMNWQKIKISISTKISKTVTTIEQNKNF